MRQPVWNASTQEGINGGKLQWQIFSLSQIPFCSAAPLHGVLKFENLQACQAVRPETTIAPWFPLKSSDAADGVLSYQACYCNVQSGLTEGSSGGFLFWPSLTPLFPAMSFWSRRWVHRSHNCYMGGQQMVSNCFSYGIPCLVFLRYLTGPVLLIHINLCT